MSESHLRGVEGTSIYYEGGGETAGEAIRERKMFADSTTENPNDGAVITTAGVGGGPLILENVSTPEVIGNHDKILDPFDEMHHVEEKSKGNNGEHHHCPLNHNIKFDETEQQRSPLDLPEPDHHHREQNALFQQHNNQNETRDDEFTREQQEAKTASEVRKRRGGCGPHGCIVM